VTLAIIQVQVLLFMVRLMVNARLLRPVGVLLRVLLLF